MTTQGHQQTRCLGLQQLCWNILKTLLLLASLINGGAHGQYNGQSNFQCREEGYHPDPIHCQIYYRCVAWGNGGPLTKFNFECGPGTVFSHAKGDICVHPRESERQECNESGNDIDSNNLYPQNHQEHLPSYGKPPTTHSYGRPGTTPSYGRPQTSPSYGRPHPSSSTESPSINEIEQPSYLPSSQSPSYSTSRPSSIATPAITNENNIPHPISSTTVPQMASGQSECQQEGFFTNSMDCKKFFRCVDDGRGSYLKYDFTCGDGTIWDPIIEGCNHAWAVRRDGCSTSSQDGINDSNGNNGEDIDQSHTGVENNNNNMTPKPSWQQETPQAPSYPSYPSAQSPSDNPNSNVATASPSSPDYLPPRNTTSQPLSSTPTASSTSQDLKPTTLMPPAFTSSPSGIDAEKGSPPESTPTSPGVTESPSSLPSSSSCTNEGFFAESNDCMKFYRCVQEGSSLKKYEFTCGEGTAWDQSIQSCNHIYAVPNCNGKDNTNSEMSESSGGDGSNLSSESDKDQESSTQSVDENQSGMIVPSSSTEAPSNTGEMTVSNAPNENTPGPEQITDAPMTTEPSSSEEESSTAPTSGPSSTEESSPTIQSSESSTPLEESSSSTPEESAESSTPEQEASTPTPEESSESSTPQQEASTPMREESSDSSTPQQESSESMPGDSAVSSTPEQDLSSPTMAMSPESSTPQQESPSSTTIASTSPNKPTESTGSSQCQDEGFFPNPNDCRKFYRCVNVGNNKFIKYTFDCGPGTAWDQSLLTCNYIDQVASCGSEINEIPSGAEGNEPTSMTPVIESMAMSSTVNSNENTNSATTPSSSSSMESSSVGNNESTLESSDKAPMQGTSGSGDCSTSKPSNNGIVCNVAGFYANPTNCDKFYRCVDNGNGFNVYHFDCPPGTIFDPSISVCNYPESVYPARNCGSGGGDKAPGTSVSTEKPAATTDAGGETPAITEPSPESGSESTGGGETTSESTTELIGDGESSGESTTALTESPESVTGQETTGKEETTDATEAGITEGETATEQSPESAMTTEIAMNTEETSESSDTMTEMPAEETTTENQDPASAPDKPDVDNGMAAPCQIGNLTDEQIVLVCPTGFRRHPKYCNMFYQCTNEDDMKIKILVLGCPEGTIYDEEKVQCKPESESSQPCDTQMASARFYRQLKDTQVSPIRVRRNSLCPGEGHYPYQEGCSNAFYKCKKNTRNELQGYLYKCPKDFVYWSVSRRCERASRMPVCSQEKYDEDERIYSWEKRHELPIEESNLSARMLQL